MSQDSEEGCAPNVQHEKLVEVQSYVNLVQFTSKLISPNCTLLAPLVEVLGISNLGPAATIAPS